MTNKLSELSKPVAWFTDDYLTDKSATTYNPEIAQRWREKPWFVGNLYSQEYVSALLAELEASRKSNTFLKEQLSKLANFNPDWDMLEACRESWREVAAALKEAEAKLATPVRLPELCGDGDNDTEYTEGLNDGITQSAIYLRRQGFKVEGDE